MMRLRPLGASRTVDIEHLPEAASPDDRGPRSTRTRGRRATRLAGFASALVMLSQCGAGGCAPTSVPSASPASPAAAQPATATPTPAPIQSGFAPLGAQLPSEADCAAQVRATPSPENRPQNAPYNATAWQAHPTFFPRATGNFTGTTDEIIRWAACKWGFDADVLRAQVAIESWGEMSAMGDWTSDAKMCLPGHGIGVDGRAGTCPQVTGLMQINAFYYADGIAGAQRSTAYNLDLALAVWRHCFDGNETWMNNLERGRTYAAGDAWGCVGRWNTGRWYVDKGIRYVAEVQRYLNERVWESSDYLA